jgi:hypothetical protein
LPVYTGVTQARKKSSPNLLQWRERERERERSRKKRALEGEENFLGRVEEEEL